MYMHTATIKASFDSVVESDIRISLLGQASKLSGVLKGPLLKTLEETKWLLCLSPPYIRCEP
jgi:hypothetical protein